MPLSIFLGRPWPGPGEPLFTDYDRDVAVALVALREGICSTCGTHRDEWIDPATGKDFRVPPYVPVEVTCPGDDVIHRAEQLIPKDRRQKARIELRRNPDAPLRVPAVLEPPDLDDDDLDDDEDV